MVKQLSVVLPREKLGELKELLLKSGGQEIERRNKYEEYRIDLDGRVLIAYSTGTVVFHEDLATFVSEMFKGLGIRVGMDEVGKGEAEGPIVVCAVALDDDGRRKAVSFGLVESKMSREERTKEVAARIREAALAIGTVVISPEEFRAVWRRGNLNELLANWHARALESVISSLKRADKVIVDSFDERRLKEKLEPLARKLGAELILEKGADRKYLEVAAASIVANEVRCSLMERGMRSRKWRTS